MPPVMIGDDDNEDEDSIMSLPRPPLDLDELACEYALFELVPVSERKKEERNLQAFLENRGFAFDPSWALRIRMTKAYRDEFKRLQRELGSSEWRIANALNVLEQVASNPVLDPKARVQAARTILDASGVLGGATNRSVAGPSAAARKMQGHDNDLIKTLTDEELDFLLQQESQERNEA